VIWGLVVLAIGATVAWRIFLSPARLRARVESNLSGMIEGRVSVAEAQFALDRGIVARGIRIEDLHSAIAQPVVEIEALTLRPRWGALLRGSFVLKGIQVEHPHVILELDEAGRWPFLSRIHPPPATGGPMPRVDVIGGEIEISNLGPQKRIPDMKFTGIEGNLRTWGVNSGAWWSDINVPGSVLGRIHVEIHNSGLNDQVRGNLQLLGIKLGPEIRNLLPPSAVPTWDSFAPGGTMDVHAALTWSPTREPPLQIEGDAQLHDASVKLPMPHTSAPTALTNIRGRAAFNLKEINGQGITGMYAGAPFVITSGFASLEKDGPFELAGSAYGCKVEGLFKELVPPEDLDQIPAWLKEYLLDAKISGQVDGSFKLSRAKGAEEVQSSVEVNARDLKLSNARLGYPLILNASLGYGGDALALKQASARWGGARIEMPPTTFNLAEGAARDFSVHISNLEMDRKLHDLLPPSIAAELDKNAASGTLDIDFHLARAEGASARTHTRTLVYVRDGRAACVDFPYPIEQVFGRAEIRDGKLKSIEAGGMNGPSQIGVTEEFGKYKEMPGRLLTVRAMGGVLNQDVRNAIPPSCLKLWDSLKPQGTINLNLVIQFYTDPKVGKEQSTFTFDATLPKFSLQAGIPLQLTVGNVAIEEAKEDASGNLFIRGRFNVAQAAFQGVQMAGLRGTFFSRGDELRLEDVAADCFAGRLAGSLAIRGGADEANVTADEFRGELFLTEASVRDIIQGTDIKGMSGRLNAASWFSGSLSNPRDFHATGAMTIREGQIGALPGILSVLNLLQLKNPGAAAFHDVEMAYEIKGSMLIANELNFIGSLLSLYGSGAMGKDGKQMDFKFTPDIGPKLLPNIPLLSQLSQLLNWVKGSVFPIEIGGNYSDPVWRLNPVLALTRTIQSGIAQLVPLDFLKPKKDPGAGSGPSK
jgi:hypothetical protein